MSTDQLSRLSDTAARIVASYVANNHVPASGLPHLITAVHAALAALHSAESLTAPRAANPTPSEIRASVTPDALISFIDGRPYKALKRHLASRGLTPATYRERYGLPSEYPMVAEAYRERRSRIAKAIGLGLPHGR